MSKTKSNTSRKSLGRGLSALLGDDSADIAVSESVAVGGILTVPVEFLHPGEYQPRHAMDADSISELAASISQKGVLQPLLVRKHPEIDGAYEIIAGERRWRASQEAQLHEIPIIVKDFSDSEALEVGLVENLQRQDLSPIEEADGYQRLLEEFGHTQVDMATIVGKSRSHVSNTLRLLTLPKVIQLMIEEGSLTAGHARTLTSLDDPLKVAKKIVKDGLNVRQAEKLVKKAGAQSEPSAGPTSPAKDADTVALERNMTALLGLQVDITSRVEGGVLNIHYKTLDQLDDVLHRLSNGPRGASSIPADSEDVSFSQDMSDLNDMFDEEGEEGDESLSPISTESIEDIIADTEPDDFKSDDMSDIIEDVLSEDDEVTDGEEIQVAEEPAESTDSVDSLVMDSMSEMIDESGNSDDSDEASDMGETEGEKET